jgi:hypothetical protein
VKTNSGNDFLAKALGGDAVVAGSTGTASSAPTATTLTDSTKSGTWTTDCWKGHIVVVGAVYGVVVTNSTTVLTVDRWHNFATPGGAAGTTPSNGATYGICPGQAPAMYLGLSVATRALNAADAFLTNDGSTVSELWATGGGLNRAIAAWAHTTGATSYTLTKTFTANSNDNGNAVTTVHRVGAFNALVDAAPTTTTSGPMFTETDLNADAVLVPSAGDQTTVTETVTVT